MGFRRWNFPDLDKQSATVLAEECEVAPFLALLAYGRGYQDPFTLEEYLSRDNVELDPFAFPDMEAAVERVGTAIQQGERIVIYGDYDCDGVTATALLYSFLKTMDANVSYYIPTRKEGYGINLAAVERLAADGTKLIITVDNGIRALEEIADANRLGMEVVVTDHHLPMEELPEAVAVVDPHRVDCGMEFKDFAGVGVAFALAVAVAGTSTESMLRMYADLVALGTVADVMPLTHENRGMVYWGLRKINRNPSTGVKALLAAAGAKFGEITAGTLGFTAAPRINAAGRLGDATRAVHLLTEENYAAAMEIAATLDDENKNRQKIEQEIADLVTDEVLTKQLHRNRVIVVAGEGWHEGVLGIAAARVAERFGRPTVLLSREAPDQPYHGSARTAGEFSIFRAIDGCNELLEKYGGHDKAAGLTVTADRLEAFCHRLNAVALEQPIAVPVLHLDCKLNPVALSADLVHTLRPMEPFGLGNPKPLFGLFDMKLTQITSIGNGRHLRLIAVKNQATVGMVMFGMSKDDFPFAEGDMLDFAVALELNNYQGNEQLSVMVKDLRPAGRSDDEMLQQMALYDAYVGNRLSSQQAEKLLFDRQMLAPVYRALRGGINTFWKLRTALPQQPVALLAVMLEVMEELGLVALQGAGASQTITVLPAEKVELEQSTILMKLKETIGDKA